MPRDSAFADRAAFARLAALDYKSAMASSSNSAALIAYHETKPPTTSNTPPWARSASRIASSLRGVLPTFLFTNSHSLPNGPPFKQVVSADLLTLSKLGSRIPPRALCGLKITALLHGWSLGLLPERVLVLDHDLVIFRPQSLRRALEPLAFYDIAGVMEGLSRGWDGRDPNKRNDSLAQAPDPAGRGWEVNSGVLGVRRQAKWLVELWQAEFRRGLHTYSLLTGVDQSALMWVLAHEPRARLFPLPPTYNFRQPTIYSKDLGPPAVFHSRTAMKAIEKRASAKAMARVAQSAADAASKAIGTLLRL